PCRWVINTASSRVGLKPTRATWVWVPSPQSNRNHSVSRDTASALTFRLRVGLPELVPSGITRIGLYDSTAKRSVLSATLRGRCLYLISSDCHELALSNSASRSQSRTRSISFLLPTTC